MLLLVQQQQLQLLFLQFRLRGTGTVYGLIEYSKRDYGFVPVTNTRLFPQLLVRAPFAFASAYMPVSDSDSHRAVEMRVRERKTHGVQY